jgi:hypothetical protein
MGEKKMNWNLLGDVIGGLLVSYVVGFGTTIFILIVS